MSPGSIYHLCGKYTVRAPFGTITYGPRKGAPKGQPIARVLALPDDLEGAELAEWLELMATTIRTKARSGKS